MSTFPVYLSATARLDLLTIYTGKTYEFDPGKSEKIALSSFTRHKSAELCPVGAFADYMVWR